MHRYPADTIATVEDLRKSRWISAIESTNIASNAGIYSTLSNAATNAAQEGKYPESKMIWLLANAMSLMLDPKNVNNPFSPMAVFGSSRSAIVDDFTIEDVSIFSAIAEEPKNPLVRSRLCDVVWIRSSPRDQKFALLAIDAYREVPLTSESWAMDAKDCWERAIRLCLQLRSSAGKRLLELEASLLEKFNTACSSGGFFALVMARLLLENNLCRLEAENIAARCARLGAEFASANKQHEARGYFEMAAKWYQHCKANESQADMTCLVAKTWSDEALLRSSGTHPSNFVTSSFYEKAIQTLRSVPRNLRSSRGIDKTLTELNRLLDHAGKAAVSEMKSIAIDPIDISDLVKAAQATIQGKDLFSALVAFANIHNGASYAKLKTSAEKSLREFSLSALFSSTHMSRDGRVIAKRPGFGSENPDSEDFQLALWVEMVKQHQMEIGFIVQAQLLPALDTFSLEHRLRESDVMHVVTNSPLVPPNRSLLFAKGIWAGFERDLLSALHLLVPQVEHLVRWHLKAVGVKTTTLSGTGIETENGLSTLIDLPEVLEVFGEDLAFEIKSLFCDSFGPNLRNEVAHGLLDDSSCQTSSTFYAWWLVMRLTFITFLSSVGDPSDDLTKPEPTK